MTTRRLWLGAAAVASVLLLAGILWASNMGFLINCRLFAAAPGVSNTGTNTLNLPYQHADLATSSNLMTDIGFSSVVSVQNFLEATDTLQVYTGRKGGGAAFPIEPGKCYFVKMATTTDYVIDGSDNPGFAVTLDGPGPGHLSGTNFVSIPYHACALTSKQLMDDIGFSSVVSIQRFLKETDTLQVYTGRKAGGQAFVISPCECYFIKMASTVNYIPSHY